MCYVHVMFSLKHPVHSQNSIIFREELSKRDELFRLDPLPLKGD